MKMKLFISRMVSSLKFDPPETDRLSLHKNLRPDGVCVGGFFTSVDTHLLNR